MNGDMSKTHLLGLIERDRAHWETLLGSIPEVWMTEPGVEGEWSIKDIIAHIAWGERENLGVVHARAVVGSELWQLSEDERMPSCSNRIAAASSATCSRIPVHLRSVPGGRRGPHGGGPERSEPLCPDARWLAALEDLI